MSHTVNQIELFEGFTPKGERAPKLGLPFQKSDTIDAKRAAAIFRVSVRTILRMRESGLLRGYKLDGARAAWQIEYSSVVEHCERLRVIHAISDSRAKLPTGYKRRRDADLLPFPWPETVFVSDATRRLECSDGHILHLIESGVLVAYKVLPDKASTTWRIYEPSLDRYAAKLHAMAAKPHTASVNASRRP